MARWPDNGALYWVNIIAVGVPLGMVLMVGFFTFLLVVLFLDSAMTQVEPCKVIVWRGKTPPTVVS